jgi:hypothetical protein
MNVMERKVLTSRIQKGSSSLQDLPRMWMKVDESGLKWMKVKESG